tara:strand:+ start:1280 stop:2134 length:855 start_codon:yes stop_codon:yes gene_type:complete
MKKIIYFLQFIIIYIFFLTFKIIGYRNSSNFGFLIGKYLGPIFRSKSKINKIINKAKNIENNKILANDVLGNYGRIFAEYPHLKNFRNNKLEKFIKIEGEEHLKEIKDKNKRAVFISGHFNNFELMAMQIEKLGIDLVAIYRPLNNIFLNKIMEKIRINYICKKQIKKGKSGTRKIVENLKNGSSVALMIDQRVTEGLKINFFENPATTTTIPAQLIKKYGCELVPVYIERYNNYFFKMSISKPIKINKDKKIDEITLYLNQILEKMILKNPNQWIWTHDRWKN